MTNIIIILLINIIVTIIIMIPISMKKVNITNVLCSYKKL